MDLFHWLSFQQPWHENFVDVIWLFDPLCKQIFRWNNLKHVDIFSLVCETYVNSLLFLSTIPLIR